MEGLGYPVVILCGGRGTRLSGTESTPKPLVEVGGMPILWHIMKGYAASGCSRFILCLGYKGDQIREFFERHGNEGWDIAFSDAGLDVETGERLRRVENLIDTPLFFATYGDNVSDVSAASIFVTHKQKGCVATMTCVRARTTFGVIDLATDGLASAYREKPLLDLHVNGGFYCFNREIFEYIRENEVLEQAPFQRLVSRRQLAAHVHDGFWANMDTLKDNQVLNAVWDRGEAPWRVW